MDSKKVERRPTAIYGFGVFAIEDIEPGEVIGEFLGEVRWSENAASLPMDDSFSGRHAIQFKKHWWRDGRVDGIARYIAHSCNPNCGIVDLFKVVSMRKIKAGEEITWDYAMTEEEHPPFECKCGSTNCREVICGFRPMTPEQRENFISKYGGMISDWLLTEYNL